MIEISNKIEQIRSDMLAAQKTGDHLKGYDLAQAGLRLNPDDESFQLGAVISLSHCNAKQRALDTLRQTDLRSFSRAQKKWMI